MQSDQVAFLAAEPPSESFCEMGETLQSMTTAEMATYGMVAIGFMLVIASFSVGLLDRRAKRKLAVRQGEIRVEAERFRQMGREAAVKHIRRKAGEHREVERVRARKLLGLTEEECEDREAVQLAWRKAVRKHHPDSNERSGNVERMHDATAARDLLLKRSEDS